jgi:hypothetical protein
MLKVVHGADASNHNSAAGGSFLDEIVRDGARAMLAAALQAEVAARHSGPVRPQPLLRSPSIGA